MRIAIVSILSLTLLFNACKSSEKTPVPETQTTVSTEEPAQEESAEEPQFEMECDVLQTNQELWGQVDHENVTVESFSVEGNYAKVKCRFSGCPSDELVLAFNGAVKKSFPAQASFKLGYTETGMCEAIQMRELCFDISEMSNLKKVYITINNSESKLYDSTNQ